MDIQFLNVISHTRGDDRADTPNNLRLFLAYPVNAHDRYM